MDGVGRVVLVDGLVLRGAWLANERVNDLVCCWPGPRRPTSFCKTMTKAVYFLPEASCFSVVAGIFTVRPSINSFMVVTRGGDCLWKFSEFPAESDAKIAKNLSMFRTAAPIPKIGSYEQRTTASFDISLPLPSTPPRHHASSPAAHRPAPYK